MKILSAAQTRTADLYTIGHEPVVSIDLMERAATVFCNWFDSTFGGGEQAVCILCGIGNNGGDGLAIARLLCRRFYRVRVLLCRTGGNMSPDCQTNLERLPGSGAVEFAELEEYSPFPVLDPDYILVDAIFGSGLNRPVTGYWASCLEYFSAHPGIRVAVDIPSGLPADSHCTGVAFRAGFTFSFQRPKLAFFIAENAPFVGKWAFGDIGLDEAFIEAQDSPYHLVTENMLRPLLQKRPRFAHKGHFGHALLICGSHGMMGAAVLSARSCLRAGPGLLTVHVPGCGYDIMQLAVPEAMVSTDTHEKRWTEAPDTTKYTAVGVGCGIDKEDTTFKALQALLPLVGSRPLVLDADALNLIAMGRLQHEIPQDSVLTPHPGEFDRLFGPSENSFQRLERLRHSAIQYRCYILLKGAYSCVATPTGRCFFNSTGNPGMATAGSGDVLTGIVTGLLAQKYSHETALLLGTFLHGRAGDIAASELGQEALIAGDITERLGRAFLSLQNKTG